MDRLKQTAVSAVITGTAGSVASTGALAVLALAEGRSAVAPTNSTSHWLHGNEAACNQPDAAHTLVGYLTHHASAVFWAFPFELWLSRHVPRGPLPLLRDAMAMSAIAAAVDYGITPKRLTPGWELVLSRRSIAATYGAMAIGLAAGALLSRAWRQRAAIGR